MNKRNHVPARAITEDRYDGLTQYIEKFVAGHFNLLALVGAPGLAKTRSVQSNLDGVDHCLIKGHVTAFVAYQMLYSHRDQIIVLDDADSLWDDRACRPLLKALCDSEAKKIVSWQTKAVDDAGLPRSFVTSSRVIVICNEWRTIHEMRAIEDRGLFVHFVPSAEEVHRQVGDGGWFDDVEVYELIGRHLPLITEPSMRHYVIGHDLRVAEIADWQTKTLRLLNADMERLLIVNELLADESIETEAERAMRYMQRTGKSQATYYRDRELVRRAHQGRTQMASDIEQVDPVNAPDVPELVQV